MSRRLIFDVGSHLGYDTEFYIKKGFRVVAIDANSELTAQMLQRLRGKLEPDSLVVENLAVSDKRGELDFILNDDEPEWSSLDIALGARKGTKTRVIKVQSVTLRYLIEKYGMPYYIKIDIEGMDDAAVLTLRDCISRPKYVSIEHGGVSSLLALHEVGVRKFKFVNQYEIRDIPLPYPSREGEYVDHKFGKGSSGPFGNELPGEWLSTEGAFRHYFDEINPSGRAPQDGWWDIHGAF